MNDRAGVPSHTKGRGPRSARRSGLTLLELSLSLALAAMLTAATTGVLRRVVVRHDALPPAGAIGAERRLVDSLRDDLSAARRLYATPRRIRLLGYGGRDPRTGRPNWRPAEVTLEIAVVGETPWLIRCVRPLDAADGVGRTRRRPLTPGVAALRCERLSDGTDLAAADGVTAFAPAPDGLRLILLDAAGREIRRLQAGSAGP